MGFIELTNSEYKQIVKNLTWRTSYLTLWKFLMPLSLFTAVILIPFYSSFLSSIMIASLVVFAVHVFYLLFTPFRILRYKKMHRAFISRVEQMNSHEYEALVSGFPSRKKIEIYKNRKKEPSSPGAIYVIDNFLFVPGLLLVRREELEDIKLTIEKVRLVGSSRDIRISRIHFFSKPGNSCAEPSLMTKILHGSGSMRAELEARSVRLPLKYNYDKSPETAEQIMAWFWQCDPNSPDLSERTRNLITEYYADRPPKA